MIEVKNRADRIVVRAEIDAPRDRVWQAHTDEERIAEWWGDYVSLDARLGGRLTERWTDANGGEVLTSGEVVRLDAPRALELTWADDDWDEPTRVHFRLEAAGHPTRLTLEHSGWGAFPSSTREGLVRAHASGWSDHMANLAAYSARTPVRQPRPTGRPPADHPGTPRVALGSPRSSAMNATNSSRTPEALSNGSLHTGFAQHLRSFVIVGACSSTVPRLTHREP